MDEKVVVERGDVEEDRFVVEEELGEEGKILTEELRWTLGGNVSQFKNDIYRAPGALRHQLRISSSHALSRSTGQVDPRRAYGIISMVGSAVGATGGERSIHTL